ncbi:TIGR04222 domain-containing membrane protein, partial [bacterium]
MQNSLWERLQEFDLDGGAQFSFSRRLARDNGWSHEFALRVCDEYKKFLYLACTAGHVVSPSEDVDQAWHLHLTYSRSYWEELCPKVLGQPLHHDPTRGGKAEGVKFEDLYQRTLNSYREAFGAPPPLDIWPPVSVRFGEAPHFRRVNIKRHYVIVKPRFSPSNWRVAPALALALVLAGCSATGGLNPFNWNGGEFLTLFWSLFAVAAVLYLCLRSLMSIPSDANFPLQRPDPYVLARLSHSGHLPVDAALCALQAHGFIRVDATGEITQISGVAPPTHPFERRVYDQIISYDRLAGLRQSLRGNLAAFDRQLQNDGLLLTPDRKTNIQGLALGLTALMLAFGGTKIIVGLQRERPVLFLVASCLLVVAVAY